MAELKIKLYHAGLADGIFKIRAKGSLAASLYWADEAGPLPGWSGFAYVPVNPTGDAEFRFDGHRAIPYGATHVFVRCISPDFQKTEEAITAIPGEYIPCRPDADRAFCRFSVMSDLHLAKKPGRIRQALRMAGSNMILLAGDEVNDGRMEQYQEFLQCIEDAAPDKIVLPIAGNHDWPVVSGRDFDGIPVPYADFQERLLRRAENMGLDIAGSGLGHWTAAVNEIDIIGLDCVTHPRRLTFSKDTEKWLDGHLSETRDAKRHIILCHAPLADHNPQRSNGEAYLSRNEYLQNMVEHYGNIIYISGHTHVSPNYEKACAEYDAGNLYLNDGSVAPTELKGRELYPEEWKDGVITELGISDDTVEITMKSAQSGMIYPRGYYRFGKHS
ncbi:MAG: metallophosphoesterase [Lachnospiraceae bacterium]|nr:metallophosphoesterase [Lachnospiraceae bacterium]